MKGKHFVYKVKRWKGVASRGHAGCRGGNKVEIKTGLADGDIVVNDPPANMESGHRVKPNIVQIDNSFCCLT